MKVGDRVFRRFSDNEEIVKGTIERYSVGSNGKLVFIVSWDNGEKTKVLESEIELLIEDTPDSVTISRSEFHDVTMKVLNGNNFPNMEDFALEIYQVVGVDICRRLALEIFGAKAEND